MSLTSHINDPQSPIRQWFDRIIKPGAWESLAEMNATLAASDRILTNGTDPMLVGTAFDLAFRTYLGPLEANVPMLGAQMFGPDHPLRVQHLIHHMEIPERIPAASIALAWYEGYARGGRNAERLENPYTVDQWLNRIELDPDLHASLDDIRKLYESVPSVYGDDLTLPYVANPTFAGSPFVGGADADWILGGLLEDCKVSMKRHPMTIEHIYQIMGYALLDWDDEYAITHLGWYFARQRTRFAFPIGTAFPDLADMRRQFRNVAMQIDEIDF